MAANATQARLQSQQRYLDGIADYSIARHRMARRYLKEWALSGS